MDGDYDDREAAREVFIHQHAERTAAWTHYCCHAARLLLLLSHGLLVLLVSTALHDLEQASWWLLFLPVWVGHGLSAALVVASWFASCPYIKLCLRERQPRVGDNPSILTEILPEMVLAIVGLLFLILLFTGEFELCRYLDSSQKGTPRALPAAVTLLLLVAVLSVCQGALFLHNSPLFLSVGGGLLLAVVLFAATRDGSPAVQALSVLPVSAATLGLLSASLLRLRRHIVVLHQEEKVLRLLEAAAMALLLLASLLLALRVGKGQLSQASTETALAGGALCLLAVLRGRLCCMEAWHGPLDLRLLARSATPIPVEVQFSDRC